MASYVISTCSTFDLTKEYAERRGIHYINFHYRKDCVKFEDDKAGVVQPLENVHYGQSVILNVKTRKLFVKMVNATDEEKEVDIDLSRFPIKKTAVKTVLCGKADDENNYEAQPIVPKKETIKAKKKFDMDLKPYSMVMLEYQL